MVGVAARWPDATLVMPGNPTPHERELRELAAELGIAANVAFPPYVDAADLEGLYALASCFVFASINEGFGIPILEAMAPRGPRGLLARLGAARGRRRRRALFRPPQRARHRRALIELLADRELADRARGRGRLREASFTWEATARGTLTATRGCGQRSRSAPVRRAQVDSERVKSTGVGDGRACLPAAAGVAADLLDTPRRGWPDRSWRRPAPWQLSRCVACR